MQKNDITVEKLKRVAVDGIQALVAYVSKVGKKMGNEEAFRILLEARADTYFNAHVKWARANMARLGIKENDAIAAYELTDAFFKENHMYTFGYLMAESIGEKYGELTERSPKRVVVRHDVWCPLLEACKNLGVEPRYFCENFAFPEWEKVVRAVINPKFVLRANKIRPEADYCEEVYEIKE